MGGVLGRPLKALWDRERELGPLGKAPGPSPSLGSNVCGPESSLGGQILSGNPEYPERKHYSASAHMSGGQICKL